MKIAVGKPTDSLPRHIALITNEDPQIHQRIVQDVLQGVAPVRVRKNGRAVYRFHPGYIKRLYKAFPQAELSEEAKEELGLNKPLIPASEKLVIPGLKGSLYPYQEKSVRWAANRDAALFHMSMGGGKTLTTLATLKVRNSFPALIICPNTVKQVWADEVKKWFGDDIEVMVVGGTASQRTAQLAVRKDLTIINYEAIRLHDELQEFEWAAIVLDEHHRGSNPATQVCKALHKLKARYWVGLSGTPTRNGRYEELWSILKLTHPNHWPDYYPFLARYTVKAPGSGWIVGYRSTKDIDIFLRKNSIRLRKEQMMKDLPPLVESVRLVELNDDQRRQYELIKRNLLLQLEDGSLKDIPSVLSQIVRLKQVCFSPELYGGKGKSSKVEEIKSIVKDLTDDGRKVILFSQWSKVTNILKRELSEYNPAYVTGEIPVHKGDGEPKPGTRGAEIKRFQTDPACQVYIGTYDCNKEGITLTAASYVVLVDLPWVPADVDQAVSRAHRNGQKDTVNVVIVKANDTIESRILNTLDMKKTVIAKILDGGKGGPPKRQAIAKLAELL